MTHTSPLDLQQHVVVVWGGDDDRPEVDEIYGPFPDRATAAAVADRTNAYCGNRITLDVERLVPPKPEDLPGPQTGPLSSDQLLNISRQRIVQDLNATQFDLVRFIASLEPDEIGMGGPSYSPEFQRIIRHAKVVIEAEDNDL